MIRITNFANEPGGNDGNSSGGGGKKAKSRRPKMKVDPNQFDLPF